MKIANAPVTEVNTTDKTVNIERARLEYRLHALLVDAHAAGFVVTVELESLPDLAMGNYRMVGSVRGAR